MGACIALILARPSYTVAVVNVPTYIILVFELNPINVLSARIDPGLTTFILNV